MFFESINVVQLCAIDDYHAIYGDARLSYHIELKSLKQLQIKSFGFSTCSGDILILDVKSHILGIGR